VGPELTNSMKSELPPAKLPLPRFQSDREAAEYFEKHSVAAIWERLPEGRPSKLSKTLAKAIRERHPIRSRPA
jgi:hypothetical protein